MFDNPKKDLQRLQQELLAVEESEPEEIQEDPEQALRDMKRMLAREDWEETEREPLYRSYQEEPEEAYEEAYEEPFEEEYEETPEVDEPVLPKPKQKGMGGLIAAVILESLALLAIAVWMLWK